MTSTGPPGTEPPGADPAGPASPPPRQDPRKAFRGPASACLTLEAVVLPFSLFVMAKVEGGLTAPKLTLVLALTLGMIVATAFFSRPWGLPLAVGLQVVMILGWIVSPSLGILGVIFGLVWLMLLWMRREVIRRQALWPPPEAA